MAINNHIHTTRWQIYQQQLLPTGERILVYLTSTFHFSEIIALADNMAIQGENIHIFSEPTQNDSWLTPEELALKAVAEGLKQ